jgi:hypothetical protein
MSDVTVILNGYRRPEYFHDQFQAIKAQTYQPAEIMFWNNNAPETGSFDHNLIQQNCKAAYCNQNLGVWARFAFALMAKTKYICMFDDDTIPGNRWIENCVNTIQTHRGLLGTIGLRFKDNTTYYGAERFGWDSSCNNNVNIEEVDIVGHSWFFEREMLCAFWRELPDPSFVYAGEDIHFSYMIQKYLGLKTYVPPHPPHDQSLWGSLKAMQYGGDHKATANHAIPIMDQYYKVCIANGFKIYNNKQ